MLGRFGLEYIDLLLLHQQFGDYLGAWRDMEKAVAQGKVRSIGISNFESERLEELMRFAQIKPAVLQVECHPYYGKENREIESLHTGQPLSASIRLDMVIPVSSMNRYSVAWLRNTERVLYRSFCVGISKRGTSSFPVLSTRSIFVKISRYSIFH